MLLSTLEWAFSELALSMMASRSMMTEKLFSEVVDVAISFGLWMLVFIEDNLDSSGSLSRIVDFQESIRMLSSLLALRAEVKVLSNRALVPGPDDWTDTATVASHVHVLCYLLTGSTGDLVILIGLLGLTDFFTVVKLLEDLGLLLLQLSLDHLFEDLSRHALLTLFDLLRVLVEFLAFLLALGVFILRV